MKQHEARIAELEDAVSRCLRHFRELVVEELAPSYMDVSVRRHTTRSTA